MAGFGEPYSGGKAGEGTMNHTAGSRTKSPVAKQSGGKSHAGKGDFGKGKGGRRVDGVMFEGDAAATTQNNGNMNEVGSNARKFA